MSIKVYMASNVQLPKVPKAHADANLCHRFTILIRASTQKQVCALLDLTPSHMMDRCGLHIHDKPTVGHLDPVCVGSILKKDHTVYYRMGGNTWHEYPAFA